MNHSEEEGESVIANLKFISHNRWQAKHFYPIKWEHGLFQPFLCHVSNTFSRAIVKLTSVVLLIRQERFQHTFSNESAWEPSIIHIHQKKCRCISKCDYQSKPVEDCLLLSLTPNEDISGLVVKELASQSVSTGSIP